MALFLGPVLAPPPFLEQTWNLEQNPVFSWILGDQCYGEEIVCSSLYKQINHSQLFLGMYVQWSLLIKYPMQRELRPQYMWCRGPSEKWGIWLFLREWSQFEVREIEIIGKKLIMRFGGTANIILLFQHCTLVIYVYIWLQIKLNLKIIIYFFRHTFWACSLITLNTQTMEISIRI